MRFGILGTLEVRDREGRPLDLGASKQQSLLAVLLLNANQVVSTDRLVDALWGEEPPETAQKALQVYVSQLRRVVGKEQLLTKPPGYLLQIDPEQLDLLRFEALIKEARKLDPKAQSAKLREALALWRGPPLAEFAYRQFAQAEIARLEEVHLACIEERIEADLACGRHTDLVGELEGLTKEHPVREHLRAQLMLSLYRSGRQAEALEVYQAARVDLVEHLGIEPGSVLRELELAILRQDPALQLEVDGTASEPRQQLPPPATPSPVAREVRKVVTVLFADLTPAGKLDPEQLRRVTSRAFEEMRHVFDRHGASVEGSMGGTVTAVFGIPVVHEDDALRAMRAVTEMREQLVALNEDLMRQGDVLLALRVGVSTGEVVTGATRQGDVVGDAVAVAASLLHAARPGEILITSETLRFVRDAVVVEPVGQEAADPTFRLVAVLPGVQRHARSFESPMVGRERERRRLRDAFDQAAGDASCQLFTILGAAGVGKSRLVREFLDGLGGTARIVRGRCLPYGEGITYWPLVEAVKEAAALDDAETVEESIQKLAALLKQEDEGDSLAQQVAEMIGLTEAAVGVEEGFSAVRTFFEVLARGRPLVLVFDDIHWGEATFLDLVEHIGDWTREVPLLLVCIARPELLDVRPGWGGGKLNATAVLLEPLSEEQSAQLIDNLAETRLEVATRRRVMEAAEGNPLFVEEMLALAQEDGLTNGELDVPPTIQALLAARLDRLKDDERSVLERAAVEGKVFHQGSVVELSPVALRPGVAASVAALVHKELIRPDRPVFRGEQAFRFRHLLIRDAAYESTPKEARAELHERHAVWLEKKAGERIVEYEEILGYHLEQAFRYRLELGSVDEAEHELARRAAERLGAAGRRAFVRSDVPAAVNLISRAATLLPVGDPVRVDLVPNVRRMQGMSGDLSWADSILSEALQTGDERLKARTIVQRGFLRLFTEPEVRADELIQVAQEAITVFEQFGDDLGLARGWRLVAQAHYLARRGGACANVSEQALVHARRAKDSFEVKEIVEWLAVALALGPAPAAEGSRRCEQLLDEIGGDRLLEVTLLSVRAYLEALQGRANSATELIAQARRAAGVPGDLYRVAYFAIYAGLIHLILDDPGAAELELREGVRALEKSGEKTNYTSVTALLARALCAQGRYPEGEQFTLLSEEAARPNDVLSNVTWRAARAKALAGTGDLDAAERLAREAVSFAQESDFFNAHGDALMDHAEILERAGRSQEATDAVKEAIHLYEQKGNVISAARARSLVGTQVPG